MQFIIITGMSGAGKTKAMATFEDLGFYCVDNMPLELIPKFIEICNNVKEKYEKVALVADVRVGEKFNKFTELLDEITNQGCKFQILFLNASTQVLLNRYKETRRRHPLSYVEDTTCFLEAIERERELLSDVHDRADFVLDTSKLNSSEFREKIVRMVLREHKKTMSINVISFGFKYGGLPEADVLFDVRFLPNPYYVPDLREKTGVNKEVQDYVFSTDKADIFLNKTCDMLDFLLPQYIYEGKALLTLGIGCTGGKHRSVTLVEKIASHIKAQGYVTNINHRDIKRG